ncbi:MAG: chemotaxis protein CheW [Gemmatimonadaceae bacterium]
MTKKIRYSELTTPAAPPLTRFTPASMSAVARPTPAASSPVIAPAPAPAPTAAPSPATPDSTARAPQPRKSAPTDLARALAKARAVEAVKAAETLAHVELRGAAAHARGLALAEATAPAAPPVELPAVVEPGEQTLPVDAVAQLAPATFVIVAAELTDDEVDEVYEPRGPRRPLRERARNRDGIAELLMFRIGTERFAVELMCVEEAIDLPDVHHVPEMPPAMLGVITVRGALTPVFTPITALGVPVEGKGAALIFRSERGRFALAIDDVDDVMTLDLAVLRDAPGSDIADSVVLGVVRNEGVIVALVDADALILACQSIPVLELA